MVYFLTTVMLIIMLCFANSSKHNLHANSNPDTSYISSTKQLQSNKIPDSVFEMKHLRHLTIIGMDCDYGDNKNCFDIIEIPTKIANLKELQTLSLNVNAISTIPNELTGLKNLTSIDLSDNPALVNLENITKIKSLQSLYLYGCGLTKLPTAIGELKKLTTLGLAGNQFDPTEKMSIKKALPNCNVTF